MEALYEERLRLYGLTPKLFFYRSDDQHTRKIKAVADALAGLETVNETASVLDVGCGFGALLHFYTPRRSYAGIDIVGSLVDAARAAFPAYTFIKGSVHDVENLSVDIGVLAGVLSGVPDPAETLSKVLKVSKVCALFDITIEGRLPADFPDLNRWSVDDVRLAVGRAGYTSLWWSDTGASWALFCAGRKGAQVPQGTGWQSLDI